jgi:hypothetical protein
MQDTIFFYLNIFDNPVPKPEIHIKPVIDMRDTDNENLDENASNTLIIILTWIVIFRKNSIMIVQ